MYIYTYTHTMGRVPGHYCTAKISYSSSPGEGSRRLQLCRASSHVWAHGSSPGCGSGHEGGCVKLPQPPPLPCKRAENSCKPLENSPPRPWVHPGAGNSPAIQAGAPAQGLTQKQCHQPTSCKFPCTTQLSSCCPLAAENFSLFLMWVFFPLLQPQQGR